MVAGGENFVFPSRQNVARLLFDIPLRKGQTSEPSCVRARVSE